jgi:transposase
MSYNFIKPNRDQAFLLPENMRDWVPDGDLALFIVDAVEEMDLKPFYARYRADGWGRAAYEPSAMVALVLYSYCLGERSSRRIENLCSRDAGFRVVAGNIIPDHSTIARFRKCFEDELQELFGTVLGLCAEVGMVKPGLLAIDGTKLKASASLDANRSYASLKEEYEEIARRILAEAERVDAEEDLLYGPDKRGDEVPEELRDRDKRKRWIAERLKELKDQADRLEEEQRDKAEKRAEDKGRGKKHLGRKPLPPAEVRGRYLAKAKVNTTDPESRIMKGPKGYLQGYNGQTVVTEGQVIVAASLSAEEADWDLLHPMVELAQENLKDAGVKDEIAEVVADAGYASKDNLTSAEESPISFYIAVKKERLQALELKHSPLAPDSAPEGLNIFERMQHKLKTERGREAYSKRGRTVEPVFGQLKDGRGFERFMRRGHKACDSEWSLMCTTHNLLKLFKWKAALEPSG